MAEVVRQARLPFGVDVIADLQDRSQLARAPAMYKAEMPAVLAREQLEHGAGFAMRPHAEDDTFVGPMHDQGFSLRISPQEGAAEECRPDTASSGHDCQPLCELVGMRQRG